MVHNYLCFPEYRLARELIDQGEVGELQHIAINLLGVSDDPGTDECRPRWRHDVIAVGGGLMTILALISNSLPDSMSLAATPWIPPSASSNFTTIT